MASYEDKHDRALLAAPWLTKTTDDGVWLMKYAPHPEREGYVFVATDLTTILFESLTAPAIPSRLEDIAAETSSSQRPDRASQMSTSKAMKQAETVLDTLGAFMAPGEEWDGVELEVESHRFFDKVFKVHHDGFDWTFNTEGLKLRESIKFLSDHLILPLSTSLAAARDISLDAAPSISSLAQLLEADGMAERLVGTSNTAKPTSRKRQSKAKQLDDISEKSDTQDRADSPTAPSEADMGDVAEMADADGVRDSLSPGSISPTPQPSAPTPSPAKKARRITTPPPRTSPLSERIRSAKKAEASPSKPFVSQSSQRSKKEREKEEEEEMEKRMEEMKKRMAKGGGGRLGKRRR